MAKPKPNIFKVAYQLQYSNNFWKIVINSAIFGLQKWQTYQIGVEFSQEFIFGIRFTPSCHLHTQTPVSHLILTFFLFYQKRCYLMDILIFFIFKLIKRLKPVKWNQRFVQNAVISPFKGNDNFYTWKFIFEWKKKFLHFSFFRDKYDYGLIIFWKKNWKNFEN